jgi:hypothetical protein
VARVALDDKLAARDADDRGDDAERSVCLLEPRALFDVELEKSPGEISGGDAGARADAPALLVAEDDDGSAPRPLNRLDSGDDAQHPVELATVRDRVKVRACPDVVRLARPAEQVAGVIDLDRQPRVL